jgi:hypothetical protein
MSHRPGVFIQWKGTDVCLDMYCGCGRNLHFDGFFAYELTCGHCGQTYELPDMLEVRPVEPSRGLTLVFDGPVIGEGVFTVTWPRPVFALNPGATFEIRDEAGGCPRSARVKLLAVGSSYGGTAMLTVENTGAVK